MNAVCTSVAVFAASISNAVMGQSLQQVSELPANVIFPRKLHELSLGALWIQYIDERDAPVEGITDSNAHGLTYFPWGVGGAVERKIVFATNWPFYSTRGQAGEEIDMPLTDRYLVRESYQIPKPANATRFGAVVRVAQTCRARFDFDMKGERRSKIFFPKVVGWSDGIKGKGTPWNPSSEFEIAAPRSSEMTLAMCNPPHVFFRKFDVPASETHDFGTIEVPEPPVAKVVLEFRMDRKAADKAAEIGYVGVATVVLVREDLSMGYALTLAGDGSDLLAQFQLPDEVVSEPVVTPGVYFMVPFKSGLRGGDAQLAPLLESAFADWDTSRLPRLVVPDEPRFVVRVEVDDVLAVGKLEEPDPFVLRTSQ